MFWADKIREDIKHDLKKHINNGDTLIIRDEKTASGRIHIGSMRGVAIHKIVSDVLTEEGISNKFLFEINDFDPMDGLPVYLDQDKYKQYMGLPLYRVPSPSTKAKNFAEYFAAEFIDVIKNSGFAPEDFPRASDLYISGKMNDVIRLALEKADLIRKIYSDVSNSVKDDDWLPLNVVCESCGKVGTTKATDFDNDLVTYTCEKSIVSWAVGCGHKGTVSPFDGNAKLPWKVEWGAKFKVYNVHIEGAGKDHSTKGGARDVANHIARDVYNYNPPFNIPYEFFLIEGKKMSSSKGVGSSAREISDLIPRKIFRLTLLDKRPKRTVEFKPDGDSIPTLFTRYDDIANLYDPVLEDDKRRLYELIHKPETYGLRKKEAEKVLTRIKGTFRPKFTRVAFLVQMPHLDFLDEVFKMKQQEGLSGSLTKEEKEEARERADYAKKWIDEHAPESYVFRLQEDPPVATRDFSKLQKDSLSRILDYVEPIDELDGQTLHTELHNIRQSISITPKEFFSAIYVSFLGKKNGPKAGWFLSVIDKDFLVKRLKEVVS